MESSRVLKYIFRWPPISDSPKSLRRRPHTISTLKINGWMAGCSGNDCWEMVPIKYGRVGSPTIKFQWCGVAYGFALCSRDVSPLLPSSSCRKASSAWCASFVSSQEEMFQSKAPQIKDSTELSCTPLFLRSLRVSEWPLLKQSSSNMKQTVLHPAHTIWTLGSHPISVPHASAVWLPGPKG